MKEMKIISISDNLKERIAVYGDMTEYLNKKADIADALGFVTSKMWYDEDTDKWQKVITLLNEHQQTIDLYHQEAIQNV